MVHFIRDDLVDIAAKELALVTTHDGDNRDEAKGENITGERQDRQKRNLALSKTILFKTERENEKRKRQEGGHD